MPPNDLRSLVRMALDAEDAGFDAVMVSEHVVLGSSSGRSGQPENPRDYALPENQDPRTPWPSSLLLLAAVAAATERIRLVAGAVYPTASSSAAPGEGARDARPALRRPSRRAADGQLAPRRVRGAGRPLPGARRAARRAPGRVAKRLGDEPGVPRGSALPVHRRLPRTEALPLRGAAPLVRGGSACTTASSTGWWPTGADSIPLDGRPRTTSIVCARRWRRPGAVSTISRWWAARGARSAMPAAWPTWGKPWQRPRRSSKRASPRSASNHRSSPTIRLPWVRCIRDIVARVSALTA